MQASELWIRVATRSPCSVPSWSSAPPMRVAGSHHLPGRELGPDDIEVLAVGVAPEAALEDAGMVVCVPLDQVRSLMRISYANEADLLENLARLLLDHPAAEDEPLVCTVDAELSKAEFTDMAENVAAQLVAAGVTTGEAVAVQLPSGPGMAAGMFGAWLAGAGSSR